MGHKQTEETKKKISLANKGRVRSPEATKKHSETRKRLFKEGKIKIPWAATKGVMTWNKKGAESTSWKGGRQTDKWGYIWLRRPEHPNANSTGMIAEHRLVMSDSLGRPLHPWENVHHINAIKNDNRLENLAIVTKKIHHGEILCPHCDKTFLIR
jgi:hypothetical protein